MINILKLRKLEKEKKQQMDLSSEGVDSVAEAPQPSAAEPQMPGNNTEKIKAEAPGEKAKAKSSKTNTAETKTSKPKTAKPKKEAIKTPEPSAAEITGTEAATETEEVVETAVQDQSTAQNQSTVVTEQAAAASETEIDDPLERFRQELLAQVLRDETMITREQLQKELEEDLAQEYSSEEVQQEKAYNAFEPARPPEAASFAPETESVIAPKAETTYKAEPVKKSEPKKQESPGIERDNRIDTKNKKAADSVIQLVGFEIGREYYGIEINRIKEINRMTEITKVPRAPEFIEGVINLRGTVIPVINLRTKVRMPKKAYDKDTRIIIIELKGKTIGFIVDGVREVLRIPENLLAPPPMLSVGKNAEYISAVAKLEDELVILMDPEKVLSNEEAMKIK